MQLFSDIVYNLSLLVALSVISGFINNRWCSSTHKGAIVQGLLFGTVALLGMMNAAVIVEGLFYDGRSVILSLAGLFFGPLAATISTLMVVTLRIVQGGVGLFSGILISVGSAAIGTFYYYRRKVTQKGFSFLFLVRFAYTVHLFMFAILLTLPSELRHTVIPNLGWIIVTLYPLATILIGKILSDQENKSKILIALQNRESVFSSLALYSPIGICRLDREGYFTFANERLAKIVGLKSSALLGKHYSSIAYPLDSKNVDEHLANLLTRGNIFRLEFRVNYKKTDSHWVLGILGAETDGTGKTTGYVGAVFDIEERKKVEEELKLFQTIFLSTQSGIVLGYGADLILSTMNPAFAEMHGYTINELEGNPISILFPEEERARILQNVEKGYHKGHYTFQSWHLKKDGSRFPVRIGITSVKTKEGMPWYRIVEVIDITEGHNASMKLIEGQLRLQNTLEGTNVGTWEQDMITGINIYNERWAAMIGYRLDEVNSTSISILEELLHPNDKEQVSERISKHINRETEFYEAEFRIKHKEGHWVWINSRGKIMQWSDDGKPLKIYGIHMDISERKRWEHELEESQLMLQEQNIQLQISFEHIQRMNLELEKAREKAEESDRLKSAFLANMSHEIRTPMNAIIGFSEILLRDNLPKEKRTFYTSVLNASCGQLLNIINDVLDISKIETGQITVHESSMHLNKLFRNIHGLFLHNARNKNNEIRLDFGLDENGCNIISDEPKLHQILSNLVSNAIKFTDNGTITLSYRVEKDYLHFAVQDTGIGIEPDDQDVIFERFRQAELQTPTRSGGTGLGLSIAKAFVTLLGGEIGVNSIPGKGSQFYFSIPYKPVTTKISIENPISSNETAYNFSNTKIMVAEDEAANILFMEEVLRSTKAQLLIAHNGLEAIQLYEENPDIKLILMDIKMPSMDGLEATKEIRKKNSTLPIIALTAYALSGDKEKYMQVGFNAYLAKPIIRNELLITIAQLIER